jgi:hypothetical protein
MTRRLSDGDKRVIAILQQLERDANRLIDEIQAGTFNDDERDALATTVATLLAELNSGYLANPEIHRQLLDTSSGPAVEWPPRFPPQLSKPEGSPDV